MALRTRECDAVEVFCYRRHRSDEHYKQGLFLELEEVSWRVPEASIATYRFWTGPRVAPPAGRLPSLANTKLVRVDGEAAGRPDAPGRGHGRWSCPVGPGRAVDRAVSHTGSARRRGG